VVIGGSAGAIEPLKTLVHELPVDLPAAVIVVIHGVTGKNPVLPAILRRAGALDARAPQDEEPLMAARIYVATVGATSSWTMGSCGSCWRPRRTGLDRRSTRSSARPLAATGPGRSG
jgi:chemotaxis response regulator CheB